jgi:uncharacterized membrane protein
LADGEKEPGSEEQGAALERRRQQLDHSSDADASHAPPVSPPDGAFLAAEYKSHSGPLPGDDWLANVEKIRPGATDMILRDFEQEREHQRDMQRKAIEIDARAVRDFGLYQNRRLLLAGGFAFFLAACGLVLILLDKAVLGFVLLVGEIATLVGVFLAQRASPDEEELDLLDEEELENLMAEIDGD